MSNEPVEFLIFFPTPSSSGLAAPDTPWCTARYQSTSTTETAPSSSPRIVAAALLSRPPLVLRSLSPFERSYYAYQRKIHRALSKPLETSTEWFFKKGSTAEKSFKAFDKKVESETGTEDDMRPFEMAREEVEGASLVMEKQTAADARGDVTSLERKADRTVYLLLKKKRTQHAWQFRESSNNLSRMQDLS